jgi:nucleoside-diphosphate-sugar epimerase
LALVKKLEAKLGLCARITHKEESPADPKRTWADVSKARANLNYEPRTSIDEGLQLFVDWLVNRL